jgi:hypothetical protein
MTDSPAAADGPASMDPRRVSPSGNLLAIALLFVVTAELLIYVPSITYFQLHRLNDRLAAARTAALAKAAAPGGALPGDFMLQILGGIDAKAVAIKIDRTCRLLTIFHHLPAVARNLGLGDV